MRRTGLLLGLVASIVTLAQAQTAGSVARVLAPVGQTAPTSPAGTEWFLDGSSGEVRWVVTAFDQSGNRAAGAITRWTIKNRAGAPAYLVGIITQGRITPTSLVISPMEARTIGILTITDEQGQTGLIFDAAGMAPPRRAVADVRLTTVVGGVEVKRGGPLSTEGTNAIQWF
ncbi:MAG: hypothetical protein HY335_10050 [Deinococcus sp.]|nr:hypothetical protein [Deinococcus sp.]